MYPSSADDCASGEGEGMGPSRSWRCVYWQSVAKSGRFGSIRSAAGQRRVCRLAGRADKVTPLPLEGSARRAALVR